jgi:probable phosphoglycerate mutase
LNCILETTHLHNRYFVMRHGQSLANLRGIIVSHPDNGCGAYGLSELGRRQVTDSLAAVHPLDAKTLIVSSDFERALETARIAHRRLACESPMVIDERLRERNFGELELTSDQGYTAVWQQDAMNADSTWRGVESANQVMRRVTSLVADYESSHRGATLLLVSHGDALQLLQTAFFKQDASRHRALEHLETAEIRRLELGDR